MRANTFGAAMVAVSLTVTIMSALASTAMAASQHRSHSSRHHTTPAPPAQIACTPAGCQPIPAGCTPVPGRTWSGLPTGYDVVVCPPR